MKNDLLQIRCPGVCFYALKDAQGIYLIAIMLPLRPIFSK